MIIAAVCSLSLVASQADYKKLLQGEWIVESRYVHGLDTTDPKAKNSISFSNNRITYHVLHFSFTEPYSIASRSGDSVMIDFGDTNNRRKAIILLDSRNAIIAVQACPQKERPNSFIINQDNGVNVLFLRKKRPAQ